MATFSRSQVTEHPDGTKVTVSDSITINSSEAEEMSTLLNKATIPGLAYAQNEEKPAKKASDDPFDYL